MMIYVGTYNDADAPGIYVYEMDTNTGDMSRKHMIGDVQNPSFLTINPTTRTLYAVNEVGGTGSARAYQIESDWNLTLLNEVSSHGAHPCHIELHPQGGLVAVANYSSGTIAQYAVETDGRLAETADVHQHKGSSVNPQRQKGPHAHSTTYSPDGQYAYAADLGIDKVMIYRVSGDQLVANDPAFAKIQPGAGPRHFTFHPTQPWAYVINELDATIVVFDYDAETGALLQKQSIKTLPQGFTGQNKCADIHITPDGQFLYGSNRGDDSLAIFSIDPETGELTANGHVSTGGQTPRNFGIDPNGRFLLAANQDSNSIVVFRIDAETGDLTPTGETVTVPRPVCVKFMETQ